MEGRPVNINIPPALEALEPALKTFFEAMVYKLHRNRHKGRWEDMDLAKAFDHLVGETGELDEAVRRGSNIEIILEAADVANFAMIIANIAIKEAGK
jgi:NTP pyrophosphatase (non-canonical NTP hydrolase)